MASPEISIIVPVFNSAGTIRKCVDSILSQTFCDWELILADNGSNDGSREIIAKLALEDKRIKVVDAPEKGVSVARNTALDSCAGSYVCFVDSDDILEKKYLQTLRSVKNADLVVCGYFVDTVNPAGEIVKNDSHKPSGVYWTEGESKTKLQTQFELGFMHFCWNKLFKRAIIEENNIRFKHIPVNEDYVFVLEYLKYTTNIKVLEEPLYHWIRIAGNVSSGVKSIPNNLLDIYNESHRGTRNFFSDDLTADRIAYLSYEMIVYKYYEAIRTGRISRSAVFNKLDNFVHNTLVKDAYKAYIPTSIGERLIYSLMRMGLYKAHYWITQKVLK